MLTEAQKELRFNGIGASEAPIITGHSTFMTAFELYKIKRRELESNVGGPKVDAGNFLESGIAKLFTHKTGTPTFLSPDTIYHPDHPELFCHLDRTIRNGIPFEVKNSTQADLWGLAEDGPEGIPVPVHIQVQHQIACTGAPMAAVACLLFGYDLRCYEVPRDQELIDMIINKELAFWECVQEGTPPMIEFNHATTLDLLRRVYKGTDHKIIDLPGDAMIWHSIKKEEEFAAKLHTKKAAEAKAKIMQAMGESAVGRLSDGTGYTRKKNKAGNIILNHSNYVPE